MFFSRFHYQDVIDFRANVVRNHWLTKPNRDSAGFFDASIWGSAKKTGEIALKRLINSGNSNTSTTCVLIGEETYLRPWVRYEIFKSMKKGNHIFGVHINSIKDKRGYRKPTGNDPFDYLAIKYSKSGKCLTMFEWKNEKWCEYDRLDRSATYQLQTPESQSNRGKLIQLSQYYRSYDWVKDDGYNNFSKWVV